MIHDFEAVELLEGRTIQSVEGIVLSCWIVCTINNFLNSIVASVMIVVSDLDVRFRHFCLGKAHDLDIADIILSQSDILISQGKRKAKNRCELFILGADH